MNPTIFFELVRVSSRFWFMLGWLARRLSSSSSFESREGFLGRGNVFYLLSEWERMLSSYRLHLPFMDWATSISLPLPITGTSHHNIAIHLLSLWTITINSAFFTRSSLSLPNNRAEKRFLYLSISLHFNLASFTCS